MCLTLFFISKFNLFSLRLSASPTIPNLNSKPWTLDDIRLTCLLAFMILICKFFNKFWHFPSSDHYFPSYDHPYSSWRKTYLTSHLVNGFDIGFCSENLPVSHLYVFFSERVSRVGVLPHHWVRLYLLYLHGRYMYNVVHLMVHALHRSIRIPCLFACMLSYKKAIITFQYIIFRNEKSLIDQCTVYQYSILLQVRIFFYYLSFFGRSYLHTSKIRLSQEMGRNYLQQVVELQSQ